MSNRRFRRDQDNDDEAEEENGLNDNSEEELEFRDEEEKGENLEENLENDYVPNTNLDHYDANELDQHEYSEMSIGARRQADIALEQREARVRQNRQLGLTRNLPQAVRGDFDGFGSEEDQFDMERRKNAFRRKDWDEDDAEVEGEDDSGFLEVENTKGKLPEWINKPETRRWIRKSFRNFLLRFQNEQENLVYMDRIHEMVAENRASLEVTYKDITAVYPTIAYWMFESPALILKELNRVTYEVVNSLYPGFEKIKKEAFVRIIEFPLEEKIRELRTGHINNLIKIRGVITRRHQVQSELKVLWYICQCGMKLGPEYVSEESMRKLRRCVACQKTGAFSIDKDMSVYQNHQRIVVQESPSTVPPGRVPRNKEVLLLNDNIDCARPGDEVEITGIYSARFDYGMNVKHGFPLFKTTIEANSVRRVKEIEMTEITPEDRQTIHRLSQNPSVFDMIVNSIAPSIYGHVSIKTALALALFGGSSIEGSNHRVRGDINVLLVGDPGLSKSQFLKYVQSISSRAIYTTGKGASAVGLTACVRKDPATGEWMLEGGALVLADQGICLIDEFDKMNEVDRTSIHEAMEQQSISISKAGIVANLPARCSVIAAANPIRGLYDNQLSFQDNLNLSEPILSRFDVLCVLKDEVDFVYDKLLANFIINSHARSHPENNYQEETDIPTTKIGTHEPTSTSMPSPQNQSEVNVLPRLSQAMLKKYLMYAKSNFQPRLTESCRHKLQNFYVKLRAQSQAISGITIVVRHLESMIRFAEASAKMHLRTEVNDKDVDIAIDMLLKSFLQSTKPSIAKNLERKFAVELNAKRNVISLVGHLLNGLVTNQIEYLDVLRTEKVEGRKSQTIRIPVSFLEEKAKEHNIHNLETFWKSQLFLGNYLREDDFIIKEI